MRYKDVSTGKEFQEYLKEHEMVPSCISEKYLECVRRSQQTITNLINLTDLERRYYEAIGIDLEKELRYWEAHRKAYIQVALSQCEFKKNIHNLAGWMSANEAYKKTMIEYDLAPILVEYRPLDPEHCKRYLRARGKL